MAISMAANAQYIEEAPAKGFDVNSGTNYVVLYAPDSFVGAMGDRLESDQRLDGSGETSTCDYWGTNPSLSVCNAETGLKNSWGGDNLFNITPTGYWGGSGTACFRSVSQTWDLSTLADDHILHIGFCNSGAATSTSYKFEFCGVKLQVTSKTRPASGYLKVGDIPAIASAPSKATWIYIEIPVSVLKESFVKNTLGTSVTGGNFFTFSLDGTASVVDAEPGDPVNTYTVTTLKSALGFDSFFFYKKKTSGIEDNVIDADEQVEAVFDLTGRRVENPSKGIYIVKTNKGVKKVALK